MPIIIDPPIFRFADANEIREFLKELDEIEAEVRSDVEALKQVAEVRAEAQRWLRRKEDSAAA